MNIFDWMTASKKKRTIERFMVKLINHRQLQENMPLPNREEPRCASAIEARVMDWSGGHADPSTAFFTATRDVNLTGLSFISPRTYAIGQKLAVSIYFERDYQHLLCEVRHATGLGQHTVLVGCTVVGQLDPCAELGTWHN